MEFLLFLIFEIFESFSMLLFVSIFCLFFLFSTICPVKQNTAGVVERFGKFNRIMRPGFNLKIPYVEHVRMVSLTLGQLDMNVKTKTKDNVFVQIMVSIQYKIGDEAEEIQNAVYKLDNPKQQIEAYVFDIVRSSIPEQDLDNVFSSKEEIALKILKQLKESLSEYGFVFVQALITDISPDKLVETMMNKINAAKRENEAAQFEAEAERTRMVGRAKAEAESKRLQGEGVAHQRIEIARGFKEATEIMKAAGINDENVSNLLVTTQYLDTLASMAATSGCKVIFAPIDPSGGNKISKELISAMEASGDMIKAKNV